MKTSDPILFGPYGRGALDHATRLREYGANACWFHEFDDEAFEQCDRHGLAACVEFKTFRADFERRPDLIPIGIDGKPIRHPKPIQGVCPSKTDFLEETEARLLDGVRKYRPAGVWLDYLTYAGWFETPTPDLQQSCFCDDCIAEFCEKTGTDATDAATILARQLSAWTRHKCERIARFAARYTGIIRDNAPDCVVGAYMCPWKPDEFGGAIRRIFGQDYELLAASIDVFTPLVYVKKCGRAADWGRRFLEKARDFVPPGPKVQLILDVQDFPDSFAAAAEATPPSWGIQIFAGASVFERPSSANIFREGVEHIRANIRMPQDDNQDRS